MGGVEVQLHAFLTSTLDVSEQSYLRSDRFVPEMNRMHMEWGARWAPQPVLTLWRIEKSLLAGIEPKFEF